MTVVTGPTAVTANGPASSVRETRHSGCEHGPGFAAGTIALALLASGCALAPARPNLHYVLGNPYPVGRLWYYPRESFDLDETGIAAVESTPAAPLTTDGEVFDQTVLAAGHPTVQLPAIARLTNLQNGRETAVRLNDRGSGSPHHLIEVTRRTASLLAFPSSGIARVRLRMLPNESHAAIEAIPGAPSLALNAAPRTRVETEQLPPPDGVRQAEVRFLPPAPPAAPNRLPTAVPPLRLPEAVIRTTPHPGWLVVRLDTFDEYQYAVIQRAKIAAAGARIVRIIDGHTHRFRVEIGPLPDVARADAVLDQALASGLPDARIVVD